MGILQGIDFQPESESSSYACLNSQVIRFSKRSRCHATVGGGKIERKVDTDGHA